MFYGLFELLANSVFEFWRLSAVFPIWIITAVGFAALLGGIFLWAGRSVYRDWRPRLWLGSLVGLAVFFSFLAFLLLFSSPFLRPGVVAIIGVWQQTFLEDQSWNNETFRLQYRAVSALRHSDGTPVENFSTLPSPGDAGGALLPVTTPEAKSAVADIGSRRVAEHFQARLPFLARLLWTKDRPLPEALRQDIENFFFRSPEGTYDQGRAIKLAANEMERLLAAKIDRIVMTVRLAIGAALAAIWLPLFGLAIYDAWKNLEPATGRQ